MKTKIILALLILALTACAPALTPVPTGTSVPTAVVPTITVTQQPTIALPSPTAFTLPPFPTLVNFTPATPTITPSPASTPLVNNQLIDNWLTQNALATPIRTPVVRSPVVKLPRTYSENGNVYFQNSSGQTVQLTSGGKDREPLLSDDGQKIVFYRGEAKNNLHFVNSNGSGEQVITTTSTTLLVGKRNLAFPTFVPGTHILLFNAYLCSSQKRLFDCTAGVYSIDTDTAKMDLIVDNLSTNAWVEDLNFEISPNG